MIYVWAWAYNKGFSFTYVYNANGFDLFSKKNCSDKMKFTTWDKIKIEERNVYVHDKLSCKSYVNIVICYTVYRVFRTSNRLHCNEQHLILQRKMFNAVILMNPRFECKHKNKIEWATVFFFVVWYIYFDYFSPVNLLFALIYRHIGSSHKILLKRVYAIAIYIKNISIKCVSV